MDYVLRAVEIAIGLGLVIFVHELGHFAVARWCGVLVERFSIGFGPVMFSFRRGDTEYAISAVPLGGYVKMLGQADTPEELEPTDDPRSYQNKSVGKRMAIISAGVIMNLIFGFIFATIAYKVGVKIQPAVIGSTSPGDPAWKENLQPGDRMLQRIRSRQTLARWHRVHPHQQGIGSRVQLRRHPTHRRVVVDDDANPLQ